MAEKRTQEPIGLFTPIQQQLLANFSSIIAMATFIGGIFVNIYILNTLRVDVDQLKKDSFQQSRNLAIIMDRLGIKEQSDSKIEPDSVSGLVLTKCLSYNRDAGPSAEINVKKIAGPTPTEIPFDVTKLSHVDVDDILD